MAKKGELEEEMFKEVDDRDENIITNEIEDSWKLEKKFSKNNLKKYIDVECKRQAFLELPDTDQWRIPDQEITPRQPRRGASLLAAKLGHKYEQIVYQFFTSLTNTWFKKSLKNNTVLPKKLSLDHFKGIYSKIDSGLFSEVYLLEAEFDPGQEFIKILFPEKAPSLPLAVEYSKFRPDIMLIKKLEPLQISQESTSTSISELTNTGEIKLVSHKELSTRFAINIVDIKHINETNIGKSQFIEVTYYMHALAWFLEKNHLSDKFFVWIDHNGILPRIELDEASSGDPLDYIHSKIIEIDWRNISRLYFDTLHVFRSLWEQAPWKIENVPLNIQAKCGSCQFLEDCKSRLNWSKEGNAKDWDLKLIPYISPSIAVRLEQYGMKTVNDVANNLNKIPIGSTPEPLYAEIPMINIKTKAILKNEDIYPELGHGYSYALPRFSPITLCFVIESDPMNEQVFGFAINLEMQMPKKSKTYHLFCQWWTIWKEAISNNYSPAQILTNLQKANDIYNRLDLESVTSFLGNITEKIPLEITLEGTSIYNKKLNKDQEIKRTTIRYLYSRINYSLDNLAGEYDLILDLISKIYHIFEISSILEQYIVIEESKTINGKEYFRKYRTDLALFYWAGEQLENIQDMVERNFNRLIQDNSILSKLMELIQFFTPSDSEISHPNQHKKIFNLQKFVESVAGFPVIINYTWHDIASILFETKFKQRFWIEHFNYMDYQVWHQFLQTKEKYEIASEKTLLLSQNIANLETNLSKVEKGTPIDNKELLALKKLKKNFDKARKEQMVHLSQIKRIENEIQKQLQRKAYTINRLRKHFQIKGNETIPYESKSVSLEEYTKIDVPRDYHAIAHMWYFFSRLTGSLDELESEEFRTIFPEFSIAKLNAANVQNLTFINIPGKDPYYIFELRDLSSNMKLKVRDQVLLIPNEFRSRKLGKWKYSWTITIEELKWNKKINGYHVRTAPHKHDLLQLYQTSVKHPLDHPTWYIYPTALDAWSKKLFKGDGSGLLEINNFGTSWLGKCLCNLWEIGISQKLPLGKPLNVFINEIYLYYPELLSQFPGQPRSFHNLSQTLANSFHSTIFPKPDSSQLEAIGQALNHTIYAIQGPPGTGKSQTIAALIDEYTCRIQTATNTNQRIKILVTAFSYAALRVMVEKIRNSKDEFDNPTKSTNLQLIYLHSEGEDTIENTPGCTPVNDLLHKSNGSWIWNGEKKVVTKKKPLELVLEEGFILFGNAHQLYHLPSRTRSNFHFDLIIVDEASQVPTDQFLASLQFVNSFQCSLNSIVGSSANNKVQKFDKIEDLQSALNYQISPENEIDKNLLTQVIIVGDYFQLPPVQPVKPPKNVQSILDSLYSYYVREHGIDQTQLKINYRSHSDIVDFTKTLLLYDGLQAFSKTGSQKLQSNVLPNAPSWIKEVLDPDKVVTAIIHEQNYEIAISPNEAFFITQLVFAYWRSNQPKTASEEKLFWQEHIGVVSPHNAQGRQIIQQIYEKMTRKPRLSLLNDDELMMCLRSTVYSVEKFQGSDRNFIIASVGISDKDQLKKEEEFIYDLNRFNVLTSRAKNKLVYICSHNFLEFIPHDREMIDFAAKTYKYAFEFCNQESPQFYVNQYGEMDYFYFRWYDSSEKTCTDPYSSFDYKGRINEDDWSFRATDQKRFRELVEPISKDLITYQNDSEKKVISGKIDFKNTLELNHLLPIPKNIHNELLSKLNEDKIVFTENQSEISNDKSKEVESSKSPELKLEEKEINIDLSDEDEALF